ncbi:MAG: Acg family FMN-binding oxidoreductase [Thalassotalea sp.]
MNRRMFLKTSGATIAVSGIAASTFWFNTRTPTKALAPWDLASTSSFNDVRLNALAYAILAPNPHNRQPWQVSLVNNNSIDVYCDLNKLLPHTDPYNRQIVIGLGCFIELYQMAAANLGYRAVVESFPDGEPQPVLDNRRIARITLHQDKIMTDPLFNYVFSRRSTKEPFDINLPVASATLAELTENNRAAGTVETGEVTKLNQLIYQGMATEFQTAHTLKESADLMRLGKSEVEANPDGIDITGAGMELLIKAGILSRAALADPNSDITKDYLSRVKNSFNTSKGYVWLSSATNTRAEQLQAGRDYVRLNLKATQLGLAMQPVSQTLQEYPEMTHLYQDIHQQLGINSPEKLQMLARVGYCPAVTPSPRWPLASILVSG